jgi:hypothetical protein
MNGLVTEEGFIAGPPHLWSASSTQAYAGRRQNRTGWSDRRTARGCAKSPGCGGVLALRAFAFVDLFAIHGDGQRRLNPDAHLVALESQDLDSDVGIDANPLIRAAGEYQQVETLLCMRARKPRYGLFRARDLGSCSSAGSAPRARPIGDVRRSDAPDSTSGLFA